MQPFGLVLLSIDTAGSKSKEITLGGIRKPLALFIAALLLLPLISVVGALLRYHDYHLTVDGETYRRNSGLLSRHDESMKQHKIQAVVWKQNFGAI